MCGISGIISFNAPIEDDRIIARMTASLAHRGPDGEGIEHRGRAHFGHRRLAIRDLSEAGRQPLFDAAEEIMVTFNGEIYNDLELREQIGKECGYQFRTACDAEVIPIGWKLWGPSLFERLEGMFAIAIWDSRDETLILARDRAGVKPLYYVKAEGRVVFASEIKGILASGLVRADLSPLDLHTYLAAGYPDPDRSLIQGVRQIPPGSYWISDRAGERTTRYWRPRRPATITDLDAGIARLMTVMGQTCEGLLISDVPVGLLLSSGIDSAILSQILRGRSIPCFTARFDDRSFDEGEGAAAIAACGGHDWKPIQVLQGPRVADDFEAVAIAGDGELADSSALAHYAICRAVRGEVTVALSGDGADEFFGGYETYTATRIAETLGLMVPKFAARFGADVLARVAAKREDRLPPTAMASRFLAGLAATGRGYHAEWRRLTPASVAEDLYGEAMREAAAEDPLAAYRGAFLHAPGAIIDRALLADQECYLPADMLAKADRMSMAHGLEIRVPFLERAPMEIAGNLDGSLLAPLKGPTKKILRVLAERLDLPVPIVRQRKRGFNVPVARLLRDDLEPVGRRLLDADADVFAPLLKPDGVRKLWRDHLAYRADHGYTLWALLVQAVWRNSRHVS